MVNFTINPSKEHEVSASSYQHLVRKGQDIAEVVVRERIARRLVIALTPKTEEIHQDWERRKSRNIWALVEVATGITEEESPQPEDQDTGKQAT